MSGTVQWIAAVGPGDDRKDGLAHRRMDLVHALASMAGGCRIWPLAVLAMPEVMCYQASLFSRGASEQASLRHDSSISDNLTNATDYKVRNTDER